MNKIIICHLKLQTHNLNKLKFNDKQSTETFCPPVVIYKNHIGTELNAVVEYV